jgi:hypothetical protein
LARGFALAWTIVSGPRGTLAAMSSLRLDQTPLRRQWQLADLLVGPVAALRTVADGGRRARRG